MSRRGYRVVSGRLVPYTAASIIERYTHTDSYPRTSWLDGNHQDILYDWEEPIDYEYTREHNLIDYKTIKDVLEQKEQEEKTYSTPDHIATPLIIDESREVLNVTVCSDDKLETEVDFEESRSVLKI